MYTHVPCLHVYANRMQAKTILHITFVVQFSGKGRHTLHDTCILLYIMKKSWNTLH